MIEVRTYRAGKLLAERAFDPSVVDPAPADAETHVWLDAVDPSEDELRELQSRFALHELSVEDSRTWGQRAKLEYYPGYLFLVVHALRLDEKDHLEDGEVHLFAGKGFLLTIRRTPAFDLQPVVRRLQSEHPIAKEGVGALLYVVLDEVADGYLETVERLEDLSDDIEERVFADDGDGAARADGAQVQQDIFRLKRRVVHFRRLAAPMRAVVDLVLESPGTVTNELAPYYRDVQDHVIRSLEFADNIRDLLTSALEAQLAIISNRLNVVMKKVTSWGGIILVPTLIAGIYGMNFRRMPELSWRLGYPMAIGLMVLCGFLLYRGFKKRDWL